MHRPMEDIDLSERHPFGGRKVSEEEFVAWCDEDVKAEWVDGEVIVMSPSSFEHVTLDGWLLSVLRIFAEHHDLGAVAGPELQVRFANQRRRRVPDVLFVAKARRQVVHENHVEGAPDLIMEIVSPDSVSRDWRQKYQEYEAAGVREYWVLDPLSQSGEAYALSAENKYNSIEEHDGKVASTVLPGFYLRPAWLWQEPLPKVLDVLKELGVA